MEQAPKDKNPPRPSFLQVMLSVMSAAIGVQRSEIRERDFQADSPLPFILAGLIFTVLFVGILLFVVSMVI